MTNTRDLAPRSASTDGVPREPRLWTRAGHYSLGVDELCGARPVVWCHASSSAKAYERMSRIVVAHNRVSQASVIPRARLVTRQGRTCVEFECNALASLPIVMRQIAHTGARCSYAEGIVWIEAWFDALRAAAREGLCFAAISHANMVVTTEGELRVLCLGDNTLAVDDEGRPLRDLPVCAAPEVAAAGTASSSGDLYAFTMLVRSALSFVSFPDVVCKVLAGVLAGEHRELLALFAWVNREILGKPGAERPSIDEAWAREQTAWRLLGVVPARAGFREFLLAHARASARVLWVATGLGSARFMERNVSLSSRTPLRRILGALLHAHELGEGEALSTDVLLAHGWPGEAPLARSGHARVHVALSTLRRLGLAEAIERHDGGFRIARDVRVERESADGGPGRSA
jgi:hypothetical protein